MDKLVYKACVHYYILAWKDSTDYLCSQKLHMLNTIFRNVVEFIFGYNVEYNKIEFKNYAPASIYNTLELSTRPNVSHWNYTYVYGKKRKRFCSSNLKQSKSSPTKRKVRS